MKNRVIHIYLQGVSEPLRLLLPETEAERFRKEYASARQADGERSEFVAEAAGKEYHIRLSAVIAYDVSMQSTHAPVTGPEPPPIPAPQD